MQQGCANTKQGCLSLEFMKSPMSCGQCLLLIPEEVDCTDTQICFALNVTHHTLRTAKKQSNHGLFFFRPKLQTIWTPHGHPPSANQHICSSNCMVEPVLQGQPTA
ncbi:unnamed protein product [Durusdinium trenchii]|uniref:Uncharacterized protein n=1 Tax=Durusdinium trenchii TaxID=1381693 RepID=A0ABP0NNG1_9DINO